MKDKGVQSGLRQRDLHILPEGRLGSTAPTAPLTHLGGDLLRKGVG